MSVVNLSKYKKRKAQWGGYVLMCESGAIYTGISLDLDKRLEAHTLQTKASSKFIKHYGPPIKVLELYFCDTREQAAIWESDTARTLYNAYPNVPVYFPGSQGIKGLKDADTREWVC